MFLVSRRSVAGTPANSEHASSKSSGLPSSKLHPAKTARTSRNTLDGSVGAGRSPAVAASRSINATKNHPKTRLEQRSAEARVVDSSLASHEIHLSDASDADESAPAALAATAPGVHPPPPPQQQQQHRLPPQTSPPGAAAAAGRARPPASHAPLPHRHHRDHQGGPASALSNTVVSAVRRRARQGLPRAVAVANRTAAAALPAAAAPPPPRSQTAEEEPRAPEAVGSAPSSSSGDTSRHSGGWISTRVAVAVLLMLIAAAVASGSLRLLSAVPARRVPAARYGEVVGDRFAGGRVAPGHVSGSSWARLWGRMTATPRGSIVAAAVSAASDRRASSSSSSSSSSVTGAMVSGGGVGPQQRRWWWWFGGMSSGPRGGGARTAPPQPHRPSAAGGGSAPEPGSPSSSSSPPLSPPPPPPQSPPSPPAEYEWRESASVRVITIVQGSATSPYGTTWEALADHTAQRLEWTDPSYQMMVFRAEALGAEPGLQAAFLQALRGGAQLAVGLDVTDAAAEAFLLKDPRVRDKLPSVALFLGGSEALSKGLTQLQGGLRPQDPGSWRTALARRLSWTPDGKGLAVWDTVQLLLGRHDSDNFLFVYLVLINQYVTTVRQVADTTKGFDLQSLICMAKNCGAKVVGCVQDATCKAALDCLQSCTFNDQVCQYRCIVSYESPLLEQFSLCILQLHNCRNLDAKPPLLPDPAPMSSFRGVPLTHGSAEELFFGWLDQPGQGAPRSSLLGDREGLPYSWLVAAGKNPAYDYFPCQHQLYYRGKASGVVWYEPVFKAITLDGRTVWRRRVYRVRRGKVPGTFHLSVLDNGVTSNEYWRILDCDDDLEYCLFYYSGAASTAGLSYSGAVLGTPDGRMPGPQHTARLHAALRRAGIEPWELSYVNNSDCGDAPLQITGPVARGPTPAPAPAS